jgi:hypothetical protein
MNSEPIIFGVIFIVAFLFGSVIFNYDPRFFSQQNDDIDSYSSIRSLEYDKTSKTFNMSIYNGNWKELVTQKQACDDSIFALKNIDKAACTFSVMIRCCNVYNYCLQTSNQAENIFIPFNTTRYNITMPSPYSEKGNNIFCSIRLFSNMVQQSTHFGCILALQVPLTDRNFNLDYF